MKEIENEPPRFSIMIVMAFLSTGNERSRQHAHRSMLSFFVYFYSRKGIFTKSFEMIENVKNGQAQ